MTSEQVKAELEYFASINKEKIIPINNFETATIKEFVDDCGKSDNRRKLGREKFELLTEIYKNYLSDGNTLYAHLELDSRTFYDKISSSIKDSLKHDDYDGDVNKEKEALDKAIKEVVTDNLVKSGNIVNNSKLRCSKARK